MVACLGPAEEDDDDDDDGVGGWLGGAGSGCHPDDEVERSRRESTWLDDEDDGDGMATSCHSQPSSCTFVAVAVWPTDGRHRRGRSTAVVASSSLPPLLGPDDDGRVRQARKVDYPWLWLLMLLWQEYY